MARHLRTNAALTYGTTSRAFLARIAGDFPAIRTALADSTRNFTGLYVPAGADGQVHRVAQRFALIAAAGELATTIGVLPWTPVEATSAAARVYQDWLDTRGGVEPAEVRNGIEQVRSFILANGMSRFMPAWEELAGARPPLRDIAGFRKEEDGVWDYYVTASAWTSEVCAGLDSRAAAGHLAKRGLLLAPSNGKHRSKSVNVPGYGRLRLYHLPSHILEAGGDD